MNAPNLKAKDFTSDVTPVWCPGCGDFHVLMSITKALAELGRPPEEIAVISGIGCSSRIPAYTNCYGFHGVHGRSLALAAGLKVARPELTVMAMSGDGDGFSIGGNHFLHACRRNVDMTYIVMDNRVYGMTKGQPSPTTESDWDSAISPGGTGVRAFHPLVVELTQDWATRVCAQYDRIDCRLNWMYQNAFARPPTEREKTIAMDFLLSQSREQNIEPDNLTLWANLAHALVNTKEFIFIR